MFYWSQAGFFFILTGIFFVGSGLRRSYKITAKDTMDTLLVISCCDM